MSYIHIICGQGGTGKDTVTGKIRAQFRERIWPDVPYTTRPIRAGELNGRDYFFRPKFSESVEDVVEHRSYETANGTWHYWHRKLEKEIVKTHDILAISTADTFEKYANAYGKENIRIYEIVCDPHERFLRLSRRESRQENPNYAEMRRRLKADIIDWNRPDKNPKLVAEKLGLPYFEINGDLPLDDEVNQLAQYMLLVNT